MVPQQGSSTGAQAPPGLTSQSASTLQPAARQARIERPRVPAGAQIWASAQSLSWVHWSTAHWLCGAIMAPEQTGTSGPA